MTNLRKANDEQLESQRWNASQASREVSQLDARAVLIAIQVKIAEGNIDAARAIAAEWKANK